MVPGNLNRAARVPPTREGSLVVRHLGRRPANVSFAVQAETRTLMVWGGCLGLACVLIALGYVWVRIKAVEAGYRLSATRQLVERLEQEGRELAVQVAAADTLVRLQDLAASRLGMHRPERGEEAMLP